MSTRRLPQGRGFLVAAGLERLLDVLEEFHFEQPMRRRSTSHTS
jgi:nicotinic acid phosphoribosyltransferase